MNTAKQRTGKRIFILNGHPGESSISRQMAEAYRQEAEMAGHEVRLKHLHDLQFDPDYEYGGYKRQKPLEPALEQVVQDFEWCEHFVMTTPLWWGGLPAKLKGLIDRAFLPGRVFDTRGSKGGLPKPLLGGRSARVILTSDSPWWYFRFFLHRPILWQIRRQILGFVGFKPVKFTHFSGASHPKEGQVAGWVAASGKIGALAQ